MFQSLYPLLETTDASMTLSRGSDGALRVVLVPIRKKDTDRPAAFRPLTIEADPAALDAGFADAVRTYVRARDDILAQTEASCRAMSEAAERGKTAGADKRADHAGNRKTDRSSAAKKQGARTQDAASKKPARPSGRAGDGSSTSPKHPARNYDQSYFTRMPRPRLIALARETLGDDAVRARDTKSVLAGKLAEHAAARARADGALPSDLEARIVVWANAPADSAASGKTS